MANGECTVSRNVLNIGSFVAIAVALEDIEKHRGVLLYVEDD